MVFYCRMYFGAVKSLLADNLVKILLYSSTRVYVRIIVYSEAVHKSPHFRCHFALQISKLLKMSSINLAFRAQWMEGRKTRWRKSESPSDAVQIHCRILICRLSRKLFCFSLSPLHRSSCLPQSMTANSRAICQSSQFTGGRLTSSK